MSSTYLPNTLGSISATARLAEQMNASMNSAARQLAIQMDASINNLAQRLAAQMDMSRIAQRAAAQIDESINSLVQQLATQMDMSKIAQRVAAQMDVSMKNVVQELATQMDMSRIAQRVAAQMDMRDVAKKIAATITRSEALNNSIATLAMPENLAVAIEILNRQPQVLHINMSPYAEDLDIQQFEEGFVQLSSSKSPAEFSNNYGSFPAWLQHFLFRSFMYVVLPILISISANLLTPHVQNYLAESNAQKREQIKDIRAIATISEIDTDGLRFITGDNVRLRSGPSTSNAILDELKFGQIVHVLSKKKNWIEVQYSYEDSGTFQGWVFTRYTAKFKK